MRGKFSSSGSGVSCFSGDENERRVLHGLFVFGFYSLEDCSYSCFVCVDGSVGDAECFSDLFFGDFEFFVFEGVV